MRYVSLKLTSMAILILSISACSSMSGNQSGGGMLSGLMGGEQVKPLASGPVGGKVAMSMNTEDLNKMSRALDKAPGKSTDWVSTSNGTKYTVTPVKKVIVQGHEHCRFYTVTASRGGTTQEVNGTACIGDDGEWRPLSG